MLPYFLIRAVCLLARDGFRREIGVDSVEPYPSEAIRNELSGQLGLSDRQLQMWFCHRRLKDRKGPSKRQRKDSPAAAAAAEPMLVGGDAANELPYGAVAGSSSFTPAVESWRGGPRVGTAVARISGDYPVMKRHYEPEPSMAERHAISFVEAQLGEPLRDDGPILGMEFDPLPPGAFGTPIGELSSLLHEHAHLDVAILFKIRE